MTHPVPASREKRLTRALVSKKKSAIYLRSAITVSERLALHFNGLELVIFIRVVSRIWNVADDALL